MKTILAALLISLTSAAGARAQAVVGDWEGTLKPGPVELRIVVHVARNDQGALTATMDSPDQGVKAIPTTSVSFAEGTLKFAVPMITGAYEGRIDSGGTAIAGTWSQGPVVAPLNLTRAAVAPVRRRVVKGSDIDGDWEGTLAGQLRLVVHITTYEDGVSGTMDSPDQGAVGLPIPTITHEANRLQFDMKAIAGSYVGTISGDAATMDGTWSQIGNSMPLALTHTRKP